MFDVVIRAGLIIDGTGAAGQRRDVGIIGERVTAIGDLGNVESALVIDAENKVVAPGFIDPHSHSDWTVQANRDADSTIRQGVTTEIVGNCGISNAPVSDASKAIVASRLRSYGHDEGPSWASFEEYLGDVSSGGTAQNLAFFVGHSTIRVAAGAGPRPATDEQLDKMADYVDEAMDAGALGMSTGLEYSDGRFAGTDEIAKLVAAVGRRNGYYASHIRNRDAHLLDAVSEFLGFVKASGAAGQISHLNVREDTGAPPRGWQTAVEMLEAARQDGMDVEADTTPFPQGLGLMIGLLPDWLLQDGFEAAARATFRPKYTSAAPDRLRPLLAVHQQGTMAPGASPVEPEFPRVGGLTVPGNCGPGRQGRVGLLFRHPGGGRKRHGRSLHGGRPFHRGAPGRNDLPSAFQLGRRLDLQLDEGSAGRHHL